MIIPIAFLNVQKIWCIKAMIVCFDIYTKKKKNKHFLIFFSLLPFLPVTIRSQNPPEKDKKSECCQYFSFS